MENYIGPRGGIYNIIDGVKRYLKKTTPLNSFGKKQQTLRTNQKLWNSIVAKVKKGGKGGNPGQWSARKAQLAVSIYKKEGGGYKTKKSQSNSLTKWTRQKWQTKSGRNSVVGRKPSGERYLPEKAIKNISDREYKLTTRKKIRDSKKKQHSKQPKKIAKKTAKYRK